MDLLRKAGVKLKRQLNDNDLRYILWRSHERMKERASRKSDKMGADPMMEARDAAVRDELGIDKAEAVAEPRLTEKGDDGIKFDMGKKTTSSERDSAVSGNPSSGSLPKGGSAHLSHNPLTTQTPLDAAKLQRNTEITKRAARKIQNEGGLKGNLSTVSRATSVLACIFHTQCSSTNFVS